MKTLVVLEFTRNFARHRDEPALILSRGKIIGQWIPTPKRPKTVDLEARARSIYKEKLPFTFAELLKERKR